MATRRVSPLWIASRISAAACWLALAGWLAAATPAEAGHCGAPPDLRTSWNAFQAWCGCMEGTFYNDGSGSGCRDLKHGMGATPRPRPVPQPPPDDGSSLKRLRQLDDQHRKERDDEARIAREADADAKRKARGKSALKKARDDALRLLKGTGGKLPGDDLVPKAGTPTFGIKGNPTAPLGLKGSGPQMATKNSRFSKGTKYSAPVVTDLGKVQSGTQKELKSANRKTELLLDALQAAKGRWPKALQYLQGWVDAHPNDADARQALAYLRGFHKGYLEAKDISDNYYRYGVRQWMDGDYHGAAKAFAQSVAENPLDSQAVATYGYTLGLAMESRACQRRPKSCPYVDLPSRVSADVPGRRKQLAELERLVRQDPRNLKARMSLEYLKGLLVYAEPGAAGMALKGRPPDATEEKLMSQGIDQLTARNYASAVEAFSKAYVYNVQKQGGVSARGILFAQRYAAGRLAARERRGHVLPSNDRRVQQEQDEVFRQTYQRYLTNMEKDRATLTTGSLAQRLRDTDRNPFFGRLSKSKLAQLARKALGG